MNIANKTVNEIKSYVDNLNEYEKLKALESLKGDSRKSIKLYIKKIYGEIEKNRQEKQRLLGMWSIEAKVFKEGFERIAGVDEAGRGPLAGPVVAAAVILPPYCIIKGLNDSKKLSEEKRELLANEIKEKAIKWCIGVVDAQTIDKINIFQATKYAMKFAVEGLRDVQYALIDGFENEMIFLPQMKVIKGDSLSASIAAASIIAKVYRDRLMKVYDDLYPGFNFSEHKGYGTAKHISVLVDKGISPIHRTTFEPIKNLVK